MKIGFIGTGVMGSSMVRHLLRAGYEVYVYNRTKEKAIPLVEEGAIWSASPKEIAALSEVIFTIVGYPSDVREVYFGTDGIFEALISGQVVVDMTTSTPTLAEEIAKEAASKGAMALDAPVSGGDLGAKKGTLSIMVGGHEEAFLKVLPLFEVLGEAITYFGEAGSGQHTKMANQIMVAGTMTGMMETLAYSRKAGLPLDQVIQTVNGGAASNWSLANYGPRILQEDYSPGFFVKHFIKDLKIALEEAEKMEVELPATKEALRLYENLAKRGFEDYGTQALIQLYWPDEK